MAISLDGREGEQDMVFIVPRNDDTLILGGLAEPNHRDLNINLDNYPPIKAMYDRYLEFYEPLRNCQIDPDYPVAVACDRLRPMLELRGSRRVSIGTGGPRLSTRMVKEALDSLYRLVALLMLLTLLMRSWPRSRLIDKLWLECSQSHHRPVLSDVRTAWDRILDSVVFQGVNINPQFFSRASALRNKS